MATRWAALPAWLALSPLLVLYVALALATGHATGADGGYYLEYGAALAGARAVTLDDLWAGPGYALLVALLRRLGGGATTVLLVNAGLLYAAVLLTADTLAGYVPRLRAYLLATTIGASPIALDNLRFAMSEPLTTLLVAGCAWLLLRRGERPSRWPLAAALLWLALTKVLFAYILLVVAVLVGGYRLLGRRHPWRRRLPVISFALALLGLLPYLAYTEWLTGRRFHLANAGGSSLYSMSSPYPGEVGSWIPRDFRARPSRTQPAWVSDTATARWRRHHRATIAELAGAESALARDAIYRRRAWRNIRAHPWRFARNYVANHARMWLSWPFSFYVVTWVPPVVAGYHALLFGLVTWTRRARTQSFAPSAALPLGLLLIVYLVLSGALSAYPRQLYVVLPWVITLGVGGTLPRASGRRPPLSPAPRTAGAA